MAFLPRNCQNSSMELLQRTKSASFHLFRSLLSSWIRPTVLGCGSGELGLEPTDLVCYVLPSRSIADLMVIDEACELNDLTRPSRGIETLDEDRAIFFLGHPEGRLGRKTQRHQSTRMLRLFEHQQNADSDIGADSDIKIVPVSLFWGHQPGQEKSVLKLILSENWTVTSRFKKLLAIIFHPNHILVQFSPPINLRTLTGNEENREKHVRKLLRVLRVQFNNQKRAIIGPDLSHRRTLINTVIQSREVREAIENESRKKDRSFAIIEKTATKYAREIASNQSYRVIRFFHVLLRWLWNNLYDGIDLNHIDRVKHLAQSHEIIYTPCHRSHIDYLLLSYVLYQNGLTPPHIAAGQNLNLPVVGSLLRRGGAFYMRRSFQDDALYKAVFDEYLHQMFIKGYSIEYFIEGSRSRTGRTLSPRTGMLNMTVRSFQKDSSKPICMMPVYFGYERVLESSTYLGELSGKDKKTESVFDIFKIFHSFKYSFGKVTVNFGAPLLLAEFLEKEEPDWNVQGKDPDLSQACSKLAIELATRINSATSVNAVSLVATALLSTPRQTIEEKHLLNQLTLLIRIAHDLDFSDDYTVTTLPASDILDSAIAVTGLIRKEHPFGVTISAPAELAVLLTYYSNNISQLYILPSLVARFLKGEQTTSIPDILDFCETLYPFLRSEFFLPWDKGEVAGKCLAIIHSFESNGLATLDDSRVTTASYGSDMYASLHELAEIVEPTLERFHIVVTLLMNEEKLSVEELESDAAAIAEQLSAIYGINSPDFFERSLFSRFIGTLKTTNLVSTDDKVVTKQEGLDELTALTSKTLDADVQYNILQALPTRL